jgi:hypothetical protein
MVMITRGMFNMSKRVISVIPTFSAFRREEAGAVDALYAYLSDFDPIMEEPVPLEYGMMAVFHDDYNVTVYFDDKNADPLPLHYSITR